MNRITAWAVLLASTAVLAACNGGGGRNDDNGGAASNFTVGGPVSGLTGSGLVLQVNGGNNIAVSAGAPSFTSTNTLVNGASYAVTVLTQPASQICTVSNGAGNVPNANVINVSVSCLTTPPPPTPTFSVGGAITGLTSSGLVLQINGANNLTVASGATAFTSSNSIATSAAYAVTVLTQPATQTCTVTNGSGTMGSANVTNVAIACVTPPPPTYTIGGGVTGLTTAGLVLQMNGANINVASGATNFVASNALTSGTAYAVTVITQPATQVCTVANGSGAVASANVTNVAVSCVSTYSVGVAISGYTTSGLVLRLNGGNDLTAAANSAAVQSFAPRFLSGAAYAVTILSQPATQQCTVSGGSGSVASADVSVAVSCVNTYTVGVTVSGYTTSGLVLQLNAGNNLTAVANSTTVQSFAPRFLSSAAYAVTILSQPATQQCTLANGSGTVPNANVTVTVSCANTYSVGVTVSTLSGSGLVLQMNGGNNITAVPGNTSLQVFATRLLNGATYAVTVLTQPNTPAEFCSVTNGNGTIASANVTNVVVTCEAVMSMRGNVTGLTSTLDLNVYLTGTNAPASPQLITIQPGATGFALPVTLRKGVTFRAIVATQPVGQTCLVWRGAGITDATAITGIEITCVGNLTTPLVGTYTVSGATGTFFTFNGDGTYTMFDRTLDDGCLTNNHLPLDALEYGTYNWNSTSGLFMPLNAPVDTNGECGMIDPTKAIRFGATFTKTGNTIAAVGNNPSDPWSGTFTAVPSITNTIVGSFKGVNGGSMTFFNDGTFALVSTQDRPNGAQNNSTFAGIEHGCYTTTATTVTFDMSASCTPTGRPAIDTNGNAGFMAIAQTSRTIPYTVVGDTLTFGVAPNTASYDRIVVNAVTPPPPPPPGTHLVSGTISGLTSGGLLLQLNAGNDLPILSGASAFSFSNVAMPTGAPYTITVKTQPSGPTLRCAITNSSGTMGSADVTNVAINCITPTTFTVSGTVTGLTGTLQLGLFTSPTPTDTLTLTPGATSFTFTAQLATGASFGTSIIAQPAGQTCIMTRSAGVIAANDVSGTAITCVANTTSPLAGTFVGAVGNAYAAITFASDGRYLFVTRNADADNCRNAASQLTSNGIEYGVYNWNSSTGFFRAVTSVVDTNGDCGYVSDTGSAPYSGTMTRVGNTLVFSYTANGSPSTFTLTAVTNTTNQLLGTYEFPNGRYFTFLGDGSYIVTMPQDRMTGAATNTYAVGIEHGCFTSTATTITYNQANSCVLPTGKSPIDMNGNFPLKTGGGLTGNISYTVSGDTLTLYSGTAFTFSVPRVLGN